ncbi:MAG: hypothetical protein ACJA0Z_000950 [Halioglobus sp.]|jgi:hypothetical protein
MLHSELTAITTEIKKSDLEGRTEIVRVTTMTVRVIA